MKNETTVSLLSDMSNFNLGIFGISITIFTVLYAFILSRKDSLRDLNDIIKNGNDSPFLIQRVSFFAVHTNRWKRINNHLLIIIVISFVLYVLSILVKYFISNLNGNQAAMILLSFTATLVLYVAVVLALVFVNYRKIFL